MKKKYTLWAGRFGGIITDVHHCFCRRSQRDYPTG